MEHIKLANFLKCNGRVRCRSIGEIWLGCILLADRAARAERAKVVRNGVLHVGGTIPFFPPGNRHVVPAIWQVQKPPCIDFISTTGDGLTKSGKCGFFKTSGTGCRDDIPTRCHAIWR